MGLIYKMEEDNDTLRYFTSKINQNNTSLTITVPSSFKNIWGIKKGQLIQFKFIRQIEEHEDKKR